MSLSVIVITFNEESHIEACLSSANWADEIIVLDSGSSDKTVEKAKRFTPHVYQNEFKDFASQKNKALSYAQNQWCFILDADERVPQELASEIQTITTNSATDAVYAIPRKTYFFNKRMRFGGAQGDAPIRLIPKSQAKMEQPVHEWVNTKLPIKQLNHAMLHYTTIDRDHYQRKLEKYIPLEVEVMRQKKNQGNWLTLTVRPIAKFLQIYLLKLGVLDGLTGFQFAYLSAYYDYEKWKRYLAKN